MSEEEEQDAAHGDVSVQRLARIYATSFLDAAQKAGSVQESMGELDSLIDDVLQHEPQLRTLITGSAVGRTVRQQLIEKAFAGRASDVVVRFLLVLNEHERLDLLPAVRAAVHAVDDERQHRIKVYVTSAVPLGEDQKQQIAEGVQRRFHLQPILVPQVDPDLLGGLRIRVGDLQVDATVRTRLDDIRQKILARSSHEIQSRRDRFRTE